MSEEYLQTLMQKYRNKWAEMMAIDVDLLLIFLSLGLSGALMSRRLPPEVRSRAVDTWLGVGLSAALA